MKRRGRGVFLLILPDGKSVFAECCFYINHFHCIYFIACCWYNMTFSLNIKPYGGGGETGGAVGKTSVLTLALTSQFGTFSVLNYTHISTY